MRGNEGKGKEEGKKQRGREKNNNINNKILLTHSLVTILWCGKLCHAP